MQYVRDMWGIEPDPCQVQMLQAVATGDRVAMRSGHGVGKSTGVAWTILWYLDTRYPAKVPVTGSNFEQLKATTWAEVGAWLRRKPAGLQAFWDYTTESLRLRERPEESFAVLRTAAKDQAQRLAGFHSENLLSVVDEASAVDDAIFEVLGGALTTAGSKQVLTGNPTQASGKFYRAFHEERALWNTIHVSCLDSPRVARAWVDEQRAAYGEDSNVWRVRVLGEFPTSDADGVVPLELVEAAVDRAVEMLDVPPIWGVDIARFGDDRSALVVRQGNYVVEPPEIWRGMDTMQSAGRIARRFRETPKALQPAEICVDVIGVGAGVVDALKQEGLPVRAVNVAESAALDARYARQRDELWWRAREWFAARDTKIGDFQELIAELTLPRYFLLPSGKIKVEAKDEIKKRGARSPDIADAFVLTFAGNPMSRLARRFGAPPISFPTSIWD